MTTSLTIESETKSPTGRRREPWNLTRALQRVKIRVHRLGMRLRGDREELLDWAETLLCNARPMNHCAPEEWDDIIHRWRDRKHGVRAKEPHTGELSHCDEKEKKHGAT